MQFNKSKKSVEASCRDVSRLVVYSSEELDPSNIAFGGRDGSLGAIFLGHFKFDNFAVLFIMTGVIQTPFYSNFEIVLKKIAQYLQIASVNTVILLMVLGTALEESIRRLIALYCPEH